MAERAECLGWQRERVLVIDEDLGKSGATAVGRTGFQRLVTEVSLNHVGLILGVEMSRLARSFLGILETDVLNPHLCGAARKKSTAFFHWRSRLGKPRGQLLNFYESTPELL